MIVYEIGPLGLKSEGANLIFLRQKSRFLRGAAGGLV